MTPFLDLRRGGRAPALALALTGALALAACGGSAVPAGSGNPAGGGDGGPDDNGGGLMIDPSASLGIPADLVVQLAEYPSARQMGVFAAEANGHFEAELLSVLAMEADPATDPMEVFADPDSAQIYLGPAMAALRADATGADLVNIAQLFSRSGDRLVMRADAAIADLAGLAGQTITILPGPAGETVLPALVAGGLAADDITLEAAPFDPLALLRGDVAIAQVRTEDEWAQLLETADPATGALPAAADFTVIDLSTPKLASLQDGVWAHEAWLKDNEGVAVRFLRALASGWIDCVDSLDGCAQLAVESGAVRAVEHQRWVLNETNALIWPATAGIGVIDPAAWATTGALALGAGVIDAAPAATTVRTDLMAAALKTMSGLDTTGAAFVKAEVAITPDGADPSVAP